MISTLLSGFLLWLFWIDKKRIAKELKKVERHDIEKKKTEKLLEENERFITQVTHVSKAEFVRGKEIKEELGWVRSNPLKTMENVERSLKLSAGKLGADGLVNLNISKERNKFVEGYSENGNPYYGSENLLVGEAKAVRFQENTIKMMKETFDKKPDFTFFEGDFVVLDGNNICGFSEWGFEPLKHFLKKIRKSTLGYHIFFDANIIRAANEKGLLDDLKNKKDPLRAALSKCLDVPQNKITIGPSKQEADSYLLKFAGDKASAAIISCDNFTDFREAMPWIEEEKLLKFVVTDGQVILPRLNL